MFAPNSSTQPVLRVSDTELYEVLWDGSFRSHGPVNFFGACNDLHRVGYYFPCLISAVLSPLGETGTPLALCVFLRAWTYSASALWADPLWGLGNLPGSILMPQIKYFLGTFSRPVLGHKDK